MAQPKEEKIAQYGENKVKAPNCIILWSSLVSSSHSKSSHTNLQNKLLSKNIRLEQLDGGKNENKTLRNQLFNISRKRGKFPQIFIKDENNQIKFIGMDTDINFLIDSENFDKVFRNCMDNDSTVDGSNIVDKKAEALRYKKLAEQWLGAKNLFKAQKFARKSLRLNDTEEVKQLLDKIQEAQSMQQEEPMDVQPMDIQIIDGNDDDDEEKNDIPMVQPMYNDNKPPVQQEIPPKTPHDGNSNEELVNQIINQSMELQQKNNQLSKENEILKQKLAALQNENYERKKEEIRGCCYECNVVKEYNSLQRSDIKIRSGVESSQKESNKKLNGHEQRLNEWNKHTQHLENTFLKENNGYDGYDDNKENEDNDEENKINDSDDIKDQEPLNAASLYLSYIECQRLLQEQQQRTEDVMSYCIDLNSETKTLRSIIKIYNNDVPTTKHKYDELCNNYNTLKQKRSDLQEKVKNMVVEINKLIDEENKTNDDKCVTLDKFNLLRMELDKYQTLLTKSRNLTNTYSKFEENVENKTEELNKYFTIKWDQHERNWSNWDINGIICWLKYLIHDNKLTLSKEFNLQIVEKKMDEQKIKGSSLNEMDKNDLKSIGFTIFDDRDQIYKKIRALVEKYPGPIKDILFPNNDDETPNGQKEGLEIKIPDEYKCPISGKIMKNPVVAYDNKTYEKNNIIEYIKKHKSAPNCEHECDGDEPLLKNRTLKTKIEQFLWANPMIKTQQ